MRKACHRTAVIASLSLWAALAASQPAAAQGAELRGLAGGDLTATDLGEGVTVLVVWASWSPHCRDIVDRVNGLNRRWRGKAKVVAVNFQEERGEVQSFLQGKSLEVPVFLDVEGSFGKKHGITWLPGLVVVRAGEAVFAGRLPNDPDRLLQELLG